MNSRIVRFLLTLALAVSIILPSSKATAGTIPIMESPQREVWIAPDGQIYYVEKISSFEFLSATGEQVKLDEMIIPLAGGWTSITHGYKLYNSLGNVLWSYAWRIEWSYDGLKITSLNVQRLVSIYVPRYSFNGEIASNSNGGVNQWSYNHFRQGDICLIDYGANCVWHFYPAVEQWVHGDGAYYGNAWL